MGAALSALEQAGITMRFRIGTVLILISCLGAALAIAGRDDEVSDDVVGAVEPRSDGHPTKPDEVAVTNARFDQNQWGQTRLISFRNSMGWE
jgi:hypothetical protein